MMGWLARLKNQKGPDTHATKPMKPGFVGFVAYPQGDFENSQAADGAPHSAPANDPAPDPDRWCWPRSDAMNTREVDRFTARLARFTDRGMGLDDAERLADALVLRDRDEDDRRVCMECIHLHGAGPWRCGNWKAAGVAFKAADAQLPGELVMRQQRCPGFAPAITIKGVIHD